MSEGVDVVGLYVRDQDEALAFYVDKLGFRVHTDVRSRGFRWLTVQHPEQPAFQLGLFVPGPPMQDEATAQALRALVEGCHAAAGAGGERLPGVACTHAGLGCAIHPGTGGPLRQRQRRFL